MGGYVKFEMDTISVVPSLSEKYDNPDSASYALQELNMKPLGAGTLKVVLAHPTSERGPKKRRLE